MNYEKFEKQLGTWGPWLKPFIVSEECDKIYAKLKADSKRGVKICPDSEDVFRAFKECPFEDLKVVFLLQDPYPQIKKGQMVADGMAMSCKYTGECQPSLFNFYRGMEADLKGLELGNFMNPDLTYLANQGVLFLNTSLTVRYEDIGSHQGLWDEFIKYVLNIIVLSKENVIFVCLGKRAEDFKKYMNGNYILCAEHPAAPAYSPGVREWKHNKVFSQIDTLLKQEDRAPINWFNYEEAPF